MKRDPSRQVTASVIPNTGIQYSHKAYHKVQLFYIYQKLQCMFTV